ncbi:hypothetical protein LEP1GSC058_3638 [Leptospira fainei serovar Hurstbridge str. BUT 6]|uniref:Uncharacterized protein n=1 Tax=Leptospira fainei serovar Hurstbridge str. BUT 6 TaxID=1193011 RepID=S3W1X1_9LEPT|nr:hypothetical protein LEP1GSC058_3638 [Leptospira fainei serovar Hurstbridge str. BUT 6]
MAAVSQRKFLNTKGAHCQEQLQKTNVGTPTLKSVQKRLAKNKNH